MATMSTSEMWNTLNARDANSEKIPCELGWVTLDESRPNVDSKHMRMMVVECGAKHNLVAHMQVGVRPADGSGHQFAVNIDLITSCNGQLVV
jgi:hypothetical protein